MDVLRFQEVNKLVTRFEMQTQRRKALVAENSPGPLVMFNEIRYNEQNSLKDLFRVITKLH